MKTKHKSCISVGAASSEKMKSVILYPYGPLTGGTRCCRMLHAKNLAVTSAIYTIVSAATTKFSPPTCHLLLTCPQSHGAYAQCHCKPLSVCTSKFLPPLLSFSQLRYLSVPSAMLRYSNYSVINTSVATSTTSL